MMSSHFDTSFFPETIHFVPFGILKERISSEIASMSPLWLPWKLIFMLENVISGS